LLAEDIASEAFPTCSPSRRDAQPHRLIRTFTTGEGLETQSGNGFAGNRNSVSGADQVKIDASNNYDRLDLYKDAQHQFFRSPG